jgi:plasmid stabilization system protein ParE
MSRCAQTDRLLDTVFASADLARSDAEHLAVCTECSRTLAQARRFERELHRATAELSPEPMPAPEEVLPFMNDLERPAWRALRRHALGVGLAAVGILALGAFLGGEWLGQMIRPGTGVQPGSVPIAAAMIGVDPHEVLVTEDGVVGVREVGDTLELVLVRSEPDALKEHVLQILPRNTFNIIGCSEDELAQGDFAWGERQGTFEVVGPGDHVIREHRLVVFAYDRDASPADDSIEFVGRDGSGSMIGTAPLVQQPCLVPHADPGDGVPPPEAVRCEDWNALDEEAQLAETRAIIFEWLIPAVRARQQMPDAPLVEVMAAARESIDKACQDPLNARVQVADVAVRLYGQ